MKRALILLVVVFHVTKVSALTLYVSPDGDDNATGREAFPMHQGDEGPLASLRGARDKIRELRKAGLKEAVRVEVEAGTYQLHEPFVLEPEDSGTPSEPVVYAASAGAKPILSGGRLLRNWERQSDGTWRAAVPELKAEGVANWEVHQLFVGGKRRTRARMPNEGFFRMEGRAAEPLTDGENNRAFVFTQGNMPSGADPNANVIIIHSWETSRLRIATIDAAKNLVRFTGPSKWPFTSWDSKQRYYYENTASALGQPGEWRFDREKREVFYLPLEGEDPNATEITAPLLPELIVFRGKPEEDQYVRHVTLSGLHLQHADWLLPEEGISDSQAAQSIGGAIEMRGARNCAITRCEIDQIGIYAIRVRAGCRDLLLEQNHLHDLGAGGICIGEKSMPKEEKEKCERTVVFNNYIHDGGLVFPSAVGVWIGQSSDNTITQNEISDLGYTGVSVGWSWGYAETAAHRNLIERNHIHHIGDGMLSDMGGIYTLGLSPGSQLRGNHIHHVVDYRNGAWGVYLDEGTTGMIVEDNVVHNCRTGGFHQHYGRENVIRNNIFALTPGGQLIRSRDEEHRSFRIERNIVYFNQGDLLGSNWKGEGRFFLDYNLYWRADGEPVEFRELSLDEWRAEMGMDFHSVVADPGFRDPLKGDFTLAADSPAYALGFHDAHPEQAGLVGSEEWRALPSKYPRRTQVWPDPPKPFALDEDFESFKSGELLPFGTTSEETAADKIRVTDEKAASGKQSLKFTDAPGLQHAFNPHFYLDPNYRKGTALASFDLWLGKGARFYHEWRDGSSPYRTGPSLHISPDASSEDASLTAGGKALANLPWETWIHFEIECELGRKATGKYNVKITPSGKDLITINDVPCDPNFKRLHWFGFVCQGQEKIEINLDNLALHQK